jgi:hypothetical protein
MAIITVTSTANTGTGSLRTAIAQSKAGDTIQFSSGLANKQITLTGGEIKIAKNLTIDGSKAPNVTISGNYANRIFLIEQYQTVNIKNLKLINGKAVVSGGVGEGGAIQIREYGNVTVENSTFQGNKAGRGGAIRLGYGGSLVVRNSTFDKNDGSLSNDGFSAGAIATFGAGGPAGKGKLVIEGSTFTNNKGVDGGAVYNLLGPVSIKNSVFKANTSTREGGAIFTDGASGSESDNLGGKITIQSSRFEGNKSVAGGGALYLWTYKADEVSITDSTIIGNTVIRGGQYNTGRGGGLEFAGSSLSVVNTTFANNTSPVQGGGLWINNNISSVNIVNSTISGNKALEDIGGGLVLNTPDGKPVRITNSTIANNFATRDAGGIWTGGNNSDDVKVTNTLFVGNSAGGTKQGHSNFTLANGGGNIVQTIPGGAGPIVTSNSRYVADAKLGTLQLIGNDLVHPLLAGSPAINTGTTVGAPTTDQRGILRDSKPDVGAFEVKPTSRQVIKTTARVAKFGNTTELALIDLLQVDFDKNGKADQQVSATLRRTNKSALDHDTVLGLYVVVNAEGAVFDRGNDQLIRPGEAGYTKAALQNRLTNTELQLNQKRLSTQLDTGVLLAPYVMTKDHAYFTYQGANSDNVSHIKLLNNNRFGFENSVGGKDKDFNDLIVKVNISK